MKSIEAKLNMIDLHELLIYHIMITKKCAHIIKILQKLILKY